MASKKTRDTSRNESTADLKSRFIQLLGRLIAEQWIEEQKAKKLQPAVDR